MLPHCTAISQAHRVRSCVSSTLRSRPEQLQAAGRKLPCRAASQALGSSNSNTPLSYSLLAKQALAAAKEQAAIHGSIFAVPDHLLLGVLHTNCGATAVLRNHGIQLQQVQKLVDARYTAPLVNQLIPGDIDLSNDSRETMSVAADFAAEFGSDSIGTAHLMSVLLQQPTCCIAKLLRDGQAVLPRVEEELMLMMEQHPESPSAVSPSLETTIDVVRQKFQELQRQPEQGRADRSGSAASNALKAPSSLPTDDDIYE